MVGIESKRHKQVCLDGNGDNDSAQFEGDEALGNDQQGDGTINVNDNNFLIKNFEDDVSPNGHGHCIPKSNIGEGANPKNQESVNLVNDSGELDNNQMGVVYSNSEITNNDIAIKHQNLINKYPDSKGNDENMGNNIGDNYDEFDCSKESYTNDGDEVGVNNDSLDELGDCVVEVDDHNEVGLGNDTPDNENDIGFYEDDEVEDEQGNADDNSNANDNYENDEIEDKEEDLGQEADDYNNKEALMTEELVYIHHREDAHNSDTKNTVDHKKTEARYASEPNPQQQQHIPAHHQLKDHYIFHHNEEELEIQKQAKYNHYQHQQQHQYQTQNHGISKKQNLKN